VYEPKLREIRATKIKDRIFQKVLCNNGVRDDLTRSFIYDNGACLKHRGTDFAIERIIYFLQQYFREEKSNNGFILHLDFKGYFPNTPHSTSKSVVKFYVRDEFQSESVCDIIDSYVDERDEEIILDDIFGARGTGLGSEMAQLFQLAIPNKIDHYLKEQLKIKYLERYNDDILIIANNKDILIKAKEYVTDEMSKLGIQVIDKHGITKLQKSFNFMRKKFILTKSGKVIIKIPKKKIYEEKRKLKKLKIKLDNNETTFKNIYEHYQSWSACVSRCNCDFLLKEMDKFFNDLFNVNLKFDRSKNAYCKSKRAIKQCRKKRRSNGSCT